MHCKMHGFSIFSLSSENLLFAYTCIWENKCTDQLRGKLATDQHLCFCYLDGTIPLLSQSKISIVLPSFVVVQLGLCQTQKTGFLDTWLIFLQLIEDMEEAGIALNQHKSLEMIVLLANGGYGKEAEQVNISNSDFDPLHTG